MKHIVLTLLLTLIPFSFSYAQDTDTKDKVREVGLLTSTLNNFRLAYRKGNEKSVWRLSLLSSSIEIRDLSIDDNKIDETNFDFGFRIGKRMAFGY